VKAALRVLCQNLRDKVETARTALHLFILLLLYMHDGNPDGRDGEQVQRFGRRVAPGGASRWQSSLGQAVGPMVAGPDK
jgi:hypothetical protein